MTSHEPEPGAGLTDTEREVISNCDCGHDIGGEHNSRGCYAWQYETPIPTPCGCRETDDRPPVNYAAVERIVAARTADLRAERDRVTDLARQRFDDATLLAEKHMQAMAERDRLAAQVAAVEALLPTWTEATCQTDGAPCSWHRVAAECADDLRAALATGAAEGGDES